MSDEATNPSTTSNSADHHDPLVAQQAREQTNQPHVRLRIDERNLLTSYANAFRTNASAEEVLLDFGMNVLTPTPGASAESPSGEILFSAQNRIVLNYYTAKRLVMLLGQLVQRHEQTFGELKLNAAERTKKRPGGQ